MAVVVGVVDLVVVAVGVGVVNVGGGTTACKVFGENFKHKGSGKYYDEGPRDDYLFLSVQPRQLLFKIKDIQQFFGTFFASKE